MRAQVRGNAVECEPFERKKRLVQSWRQWAGGVAYAALTMLVRQTMPLLRSTPLVACSASAPPLPSPCFSVSQLHALRRLPQVGELDEQPEAAYPAGYDVYRSADYKGDFDGYSGEVVYVDDASAPTHVPTPSAA